MSTRRMSLAAALAALFLGLAPMVGCGAVDHEPEIVNAKVEPASWKISGLANEATFKLTVDLVHFDDPVTSVVAQVEGMPNVKFTLQRQEEIGNGERWSVSTEMTLWTGISSGTYHIDVTATDAQGRATTKVRAATVTITD